MASSSKLAFLRDGHKVANALMVLIALGFFAFFASAAMAQSGNVYSERAAQIASPVKQAIVLQARLVKVEPANGTRYTGAAAGAALGAGLGLQAARRGGMQGVLAIAGTALGGLAGNTVADQLGAGRAVEYVLQVMLPDGRLGEVLAIVQPEPAEAVPAGVAVYLVNTAGHWRVVPNEAARAAMAGGLASPVLPMVSPPVRPLPGFHTVDFK